MFVVAVDYSRVFYYALTLENAARAGAAYGCRDTSHSLDTSGIEAAALADASNLHPAPTVSSTRGVDADGNAVVNVTVAWTFRTLTNFPGLPSESDLTRTVSMRVLP
jgi:Flp pilus assembly protein TadG